LESEPVAETKVMAEVACAGSVHATTATARRNKEKNGVKRFIITSWSWVADLIEPGVPSLIS
jgi:protein-disulfide isomerase-like protein with CxxC motif